MQKKQKGFTLIELLVVISIIGLLASVLMVSLNSARKKARNAQRMGNLRQLSTALEFYYNDNGTYPSTCHSGQMSCTAAQADWWGSCVNVGAHPDVDDPSTGTKAWIPGLTPKYVVRLPSDSLSGRVNRDRNPTRCGDPGETCYQYVSNGTDYKVAAFCLPEGPDWDEKHPFYDPGWPWDMKAWVVFTSGAASWY